MPTYVIEQFELHSMKYRVEAASGAEAIDRLFAGEAEPLEQSQDFIEVADDFGLPVAEHRELADALQKLGRMQAEDEVIPSIRSIEQVGVPTARHPYSTEGPDNEDDAQPGR